MRLDLLRSQVSIGTAAMLLLAAPTAGNSALCWDVKEGYNAVSRMIHAPKKERRPEVFYFGEFDSVQACRQACEQQEQCAAFTWMGVAASGGWLGGGGKWARQCYGRGMQAMTMVPEKGRVSGLKVPCDELKDLQRSTGTNPATMQRGAQSDVIYDSAAKPGRQHHQQRQQQKQQQTVEMESLLGRGAGGKAA
eukprot:CAMPEP_0119306214 /NCGR_PEP_ID=MMETSP1333-20130426/7019_1 /TAXON_ID=418940 /ORGANISM="Scyphosphaera apsteinii, Strain RCC1455" /LENGTH=192 /DNA_ID=CAMNT_0007309461 /DNA_START=179 /DNA_END=753 /DNA_ORIENTATION=+